LGKLPKEIVDFLDNPLVTKVLATADEYGNVHAAPIASLRATPDGSMIIFAQVFSSKTPENLVYMKRVGKQAVIVAQLFSPPKIEGYIIRCNVGEQLTSGPIFEQVSEGLKKALGLSTKAVWTLIPMEYKVCTPGPNFGRIIKL
jgi:hypothetical protein